MDKLIHRNNTSFRKSLTEVIKAIRTESDPLKYHQRIVNEYVMKYTHVRGLLVYQEMGSGKTILAASICDDVIRSGKMRKVLFISAKTLHGNFVDDYKKYLRMARPEMEDVDSYITEHCRFITLTANNMLQQVHRATTADDHVFAEESKGNIDNTLVVIDEAHNFFNGITNGSQNYIGLYELIMKARRVKILFLSGSPIMNDPFEVALCFNMLNGYFRDGTTLFGEEYDDFRRYFVSSPYADMPESTNTEIPTIKRSDKFSDRITGLVSYYGTDQEEIRKLFPRLEELIVHRVPMSVIQYATYSGARDREQDETKRGAFRVGRKPLQKPQGASSSYRVRSRQFSNFVWPKYASNTYKDDRGFEHFERFIDRLRPEDFVVVDKNVRYRRTGGIPPVEREIDKAIEKIVHGGKDEPELGLETWSPKMVQLLVNVAVHLPPGMLDEFKQLGKKEPWIPELIRKKQKIGVGPGIIYSQFLESGIAIIVKILKQYGMQEAGKNVSSAKGTFAVISGEVDPELRTELVRMVMSPDNKSGALVSLLLITAAGAEGISTNFMRHVHALEPFWHWLRLEQFFARGARLGSHTALPPEEQTVQPYLYLSDYPVVFEDKEQAKVKEQEETTDVTLYHKAIQNRILIDSFLKVMQESSIDCTVHYDKLKCRTCMPTNEPLYVENLDQDIKSPSPCQELQEEKIKAKSVIVEDDSGQREYMYTDPDLKIFEFAPELNAWHEIPPEHPDYLVVYKKIRANRSA